MTIRECEPPARFKLPGKDVEQGLANLKSLAERQSAAAIGARIDA